MKQLMLTKIQFEFEIKPSLVEKCWAFLFIRVICFQILSMFFLQLFNIIFKYTWDEFGLFSFQIGITDPAITIGMDQTKSETKLREYLEHNLSREAKEKYKIYIGALFHFWFDPCQL